MSPPHSNASPISFDPTPHTLSFPPKPKTYHPLHRTFDINNIAMQNNFPPTAWIDPEYHGIPANLAHRSVSAPLDDHEQAYLHYLLDKSHNRMDEQSFRWTMAIIWSFRRRIYELEQLVKNAESTAAQESPRPATAQELVGDVLARRCSQDSLRSGRSTSPVQRDMATLTSSLIGSSNELMKEFGERDNKVSVGVKQVDEPDLADFILKNPSTAAGNYGSSEETFRSVQSTGTRSIQNDTEDPKPFSSAVQLYRPSTPRFVVKASGSPLLVSTKDDEEKPFKSWADEIESGSSSSDDGAMSLSLLPPLTPDLGSDKSSGDADLKVGTPSPHLKLQRSLTTNQYHQTKAEFGKIDINIAAVHKDEVEADKKTGDDVKLPTGEQSKHQTENGKSPAAADRWELHPKEHFARKRDTTEVVGSRRRPVPKTTATRKANVASHLHDIEQTGETVKAGGDQEDEVVFNSSKRRDAEEGWVKPPPDVSPVRIDPRHERNTFGSFYTSGEYKEARVPAPIFVKAVKEEPASAIAAEPADVEPPVVPIVQRKLRYQRLPFTYKRREDRVKALKDWRMDRFSEFLAARHQTEGYENCSIEEMVMRHAYGPKVMLADDWLARIAKMLYKYEMNTMEDLQLLLNTRYNITHCDSLIDNLHCLRATGKLLENEDRNKNLGKLPREKVRQIITDLLGLDLEPKKD
jgi:hypothetical protein